MPKLSTEKRNRLILVLAAGLILAAGVWYGVIKTRNVELERTQVKLVAAQDKLQRAKRWVEQADQLESDMQAVVGRLKSLESEMAPADLLSWAYALLERAKAGQNVDIIEVTRPQTNEVGLLAGFPYLAATFTVRGIAHYHDYGKFVADFENRFPYFRTQNLSLAANPETSSEVQGTR